jgi:Arc/MetJ-type ribon-helix-helix transcriptional regulator
MTTMNPVRITVRLDRHLERRLREEARVAGTNESEVVREALAVYFESRKRPETALDVARRAGVIGCATRLPADLSTNKEHFEGFGR